MERPAHPNITIRLAQPADAPALARLRYRFRATWGEAVESEAAFVERATAWFAARLATASLRGWVAVDEHGEMVGHVFVQFVEKIPNPLPEPEAIGYLTNAYVAPGWRAQGLGGRLIEAALAACDAADLESV